MSQCGHSIVLWSRLRLLRRPPPLQGGARLGGRGLLQLARAQLRLRDGADNTTVVTLPTWFYTRVPADTQALLLAEVKGKLAFWRGVHVER